MRNISLKAPSFAVLSMLLLLGVSSPQAGLARAQESRETKPSAQASDQPPWISIVVVRVKPEMVPEFLKLAKETLAAHRKAGVEWRDFWVTDSFGAFFEYTIVLPFNKFAEYDGGSPLEKGLGKEGFASWQAKASRVLTSVNSYAVRTRPDLSYIGNMTEPPKLGVVSSTKVAPGREQEFENFLKNDYLPVMKRSGIKGFFVGNTVFGGDANEYVSLTLADNFADIDKGPPIRRVLSEAEAEKLSKKLAPGVVIGTSRSIVRYIPELSILPSPPGSGNERR